MKTKIESVHYLGLMILASLLIFAAEGHADTTQSSDPSVSTSSSVSSNSSSVSSIISPSDNGVNSVEDARRSKKRRDSRLFYGGVCVGQTLAKQGIYLSDVPENANPGAVHDLKSSIKAAILSCKSQVQSSALQGASPTPAPSATPSSSPVSISLPVTTTTVSSD